MPAGIKDWPELDYTECPFTTDSASRKNNTDEIAFYMSPTLIQ